jgi:uncharacterized membrane protein (UPF0127 family)
VWRLLALICVIGLLPAACSDSNPPAAQVLPETPLTIEQGGQVQHITVEVASTEPQRETGLMWRQEMADDHGMLFVFPSDTKTGFWMKNTYIPLDIAYVWKAGEVLAIVHGKPLDTTTLDPPGPYRYALEMNGGWFEGHGLGKGARVRFPQKLPQAH